MKRQINFRTMLGLCAGVALEFRPLGLHYSLFNK